MAGQVIDGVATLGDGHRHDLGIRAGDSIDDGVRIRMTVDIFDDAANDLHLGLRGAAIDQAVEGVLSSEGIPHCGITSEDTAPNNAPSRCARLAQFVDVGGEMGAMKAADPDVHDACS